MTQVVVLAHAADAGAASVVAALRVRLGNGGVRVVRPEALGVAKWSHRVDTRGRAATRIELAGAPPLECAAIGAVLNRIRFLPLAQFRRSTPKDRDYAGAEMQALVASWLAAFGARAIHDLRRHPCVTPSVHRHAWSAAAAECGLPLAAARVATTARWMRAEDSAVVDDAPGDAVLVAGDEVVGPLSERFGQACRAVAHRLGFALLEFRFARSEGRWVVADVDPLPALERPPDVAAACRLVESRLVAEAA
jgi:hypothetical protein